MTIFKMTGTLPRLIMMTTVAVLLLPAADIALARNGGHSDNQNRGVRNGGSDRKGSERLTVKRVDNGNRAGNVAGKAKSSGTGKITSSVISTGPRPGIPRPGGAGTTTGNTDSKPAPGGGGGGGTPLPQKPVIVTAPGTGSGTGTGTGTGTGGGRTLPTIPLDPNKGNGAGLPEKPVETGGGRPLPTIPIDPNKGGSTGSDNKHGEHDKHGDREHDKKHEKETHKKDHGKKHKKDHEKDHTTNSPPIIKDKPPVVSKPPVDKPGPVVDKPAPDKPGPVVGGTPPVAPPSGPVVRDHRPGGNASDAPPARVINREPPIVRDHRGNEESNPAPVMRDPRPGAGGKSSDKGSGSGGIVGVVKSIGNGLEDLGTAAISIGGPTSQPKTSTTTQQ